jgi:hypothetical protein
MFPAKRQKKTVNPTLKGYRSSCRVDKYNLGIIHESMCPVLGELAVEQQLGFF